MATILHDFQRTVPLCLSSLPPLLLYYSTTWTREMLERDWVFLSRCRGVRMCVCVSVVVPFVDCMIYFPTNKHVVVQQKYYISSSSCINISVNVILLRTSREPKHGMSPQTYLYVIIGNKGLLSMLVLRRL